MQSLCRRIYSEHSVANIEDQIVSIKEVFRLQRADELIAAEERYLPKRGDPVRAIVLAASRGTEMGDLTALKPKAMLTIGGKPLLHRQVTVFRNAGIKDILVVRGYGKSEVEVPDVKFVDNDAFADTGEIYSLYQAIGVLKGEVVISFGDILFRQYIMNALLAETGDIVLVVDAAWKERSGTDTCRDFVTTTRPYSIKYDESDVFLAGLVHDLPAQKTDGEWIGLLRCSVKGSEIMAETLRQLSARADFKKLRFDALFEHLLHKGVPIKVCYIIGHWLDVDRLEDLARAQTF
jgi:phosphoenolpyruvate phosphomutase